MAEMIYQNAFQNKRVFITGHTGFKGAWMAIYLKHLGAELFGYSLPAPTEPSLYEAAKLSTLFTQSTIADLANRDALRTAIDEANPHSIFHFAAQPIVIDSYNNPYETIQTNVMGSVNLLEVVRELGRPCHVVMVITDKCYRNQEWLYGYREHDPLGGKDPYSASKSAADILIDSYRQSFFHGDSDIRVASVRSGNVIGGGDWADYRIVPDAVRAFSQNAPLQIRNPHAVRPWQHVLETSSAYLTVAAKLDTEAGQRYADVWNFGPLPIDVYSVGALGDEMLKHWQGARWELSDPDADLQAKKEANLLMLNIDKSFNLLGWQPVWRFAETVQKTIGWYHAFYTQSADAYQLCLADIQAYEASATA